MPGPNGWHNFTMKKNCLTVVSVIHYIRLVYRSVLFILLLISYIGYRIHEGEEITSTLEKQPLILVVTWAVFVVEMVLRFFPSRFESPGCQKQFTRNYIKSGSTDIKVQDNNATVLIALIWIIFNGCIGALRMLDILDDGILILLCSAFSICDDLHPVLLSFPVMVHEKQMLRHLPYL